MSSVFIFVGVYIIWIIFIICALFCEEMKKRRQAQMVERVLRAANLQTVYDTTQRIHEGTTLNRIVACVTDDREQQIDGERSETPLEVVIFVPSTEDLPPPYTEIEIALPSYEDCLGSF